MRALSALAEILVGVVSDAVKTYMSMMYSYVRQQTTTTLRYDPTTLAMTSSRYYRDVTVTSSRTCFNVGLTSARKCTLSISNIVSLPTMRLFDNEKYFLTKRVTADCQLTSLRSVCGM